MLCSRLAAQCLYPPFKIITNLEDPTVVSFKIAEAEEVKIDLTLSLKTAKGCFLHSFLLPVMIGVASYCSFCWRRRELMETLSSRIVIWSVNMPQMTVMPVGLFWALSGIVEE